MTERVYNVLVLRTGDTVRSIFAEGALREDGAGRFNGFSAGSRPDREIEVEGASHGHKAEA